MPIGGQVCSRRTLARTVLSEAGSSLPLPSLTAAFAPDSLWFSHFTARPA